MVRKMNWCKCKLSIVKKEVGTKKDDPYGYYCIECGKPLPIKEQIN